MFNIGRGKKRKNQEGYYQGVDSQGRVSWKKVVEAASDIPFQDLVNAQNDYVQVVDAAAAAYYSGNRQQTAQMWRKAAEIRSTIRSIGEFGMALDDQNLNLEEWSKNYEEFRKELGLDSDHKSADITGFKYANAFISQEELADVTGAIEESLDLHRRFSDGAGMSMGEPAGDNLQVIISDEGVFLKNAQDKYAEKIDEESEWILHGNGKVEKNPHFSGAPSPRSGNPDVRYKTFKRVDDNGRVFVESVPVDKNGNPIDNSRSETHPDTLEFPPQHPESHMRVVDESADTIQFSSPRSRRDRHDDTPPVFSPPPQDRDNISDEPPTFRPRGSASAEGDTSSPSSRRRKEQSEEKISSPPRSHRDDKTPGEKKNQSEEKISSPRPQEEKSQESRKPYARRKEQGSSRRDTGNTENSPKEKPHNSSPQGNSTRASQGNNSRQEGEQKKGRGVNYEDRRTNPRSVNEAEEYFDSFSEHEFTESKESFNRRVRADRKRRKDADNRERGILHAAESATGMGQMGRFRPSTPHRVGPFKIYFGRQFPKPSSLHLSLGFFSFRLWSATHRAGISSMNVLPGYMHFRFNPKAKDRLEEGSKQKRSKK